MLEKRRSIRVDVNNICEIRIQALNEFGYCFLKDVSVLGVGFLSPDKYSEGEKADLTIVLDSKIIELEISIVAAYYKTEGQNRYGAEITYINEVSKEILEEYVTSRVHADWERKIKELIQ